MSNQLLHDQIILCKCRRPSLLPLPPHVHLSSYAFLNPPLLLGVQISPPHQPHPLHYSCDSSNPPPSPDLMIPPRLHPPPLPPALHCLHRLLLLLRLCTIIAGTSLSAGEYITVPDSPFLAFANQAATMANGLGGIAAGCMPPAHTRKTQYKTVHACKS